MAAQKPTPKPAARRARVQRGRRKAHSKAGAAESFAVVAIGASAGGLEPIGQFLSAMPADSGLAFVVIQHLDPTAKSLLPELLAKHTAMAVRIARDGIAVMPNVVQVIPPGMHLSIDAGRLRLTPAPPGHGARMPIDGFLRSLAADLGDHAIGIVMSGTGTDGAIGLKTVKEAGGLALVQDPSEAAHDGMPRNAMLTAGPDHVGPVRDMPGLILRYVAHDYVKAHPVSSDAPIHDDHTQDLVTVVDTLRSVTGRDFERYKIGTVRRRVERRMALSAIVDWSAYCALLRQSPTEADALAKDLLINVTSFFRDPEAFADLANRVLPELLNRHSSDEPVRVWVPGCSTGEEAYSIAMLLSERIAAVRRRHRFQIFATDIDDDALQIARMGVYADAIQATVSPERLDRFFTRVDDHYKIAAGLRQSVIFSHHDVLSDPAFSRLDLISCRNLFIYLKPEVQSRVLALFHFGLRADGILLLGSSESIGGASDLFQTLDRQHRIYRRIGRARPVEIGRATSRGGARWMAGGQAGTQASLPLAELARRALLDDFTPASVVVNRQFIGLHYFGATDRYLKIAPGESSQDLRLKAREGLQLKLRDVIDRCFRGARRVAARGVPFKRDGRAGKVTIVARPLTGHAEELAVVSFVDEPSQPRPVKALPGGKSAESGLVKLLRQELNEARAQLKAATHDFELADEEMKAANEEAMSMNEEFLSTNEELETSKEELQSLNEELTTVNGQLHQALEQQQQAAADLSNLLDCSGIATVFLDRNLNIKFFNPAMTSLFAVIDKDIGRPLADLTQKFADPLLLSDAAATLANSVPIEREIKTFAGQWFTRSVLPYRLPQGEVQGVVVTFADVSRLKQLEAANAAARGYAEAIVEAVRNPLVVLDFDLKIVSANSAFRRAFHPSLDTIEGGGMQDLQDAAFRRPPWKEWLAQISSARQDLGGFDLTLDQPGGGYRTLEVTASEFRAGTPDRRLFLLAFQDVTERRHIVLRQLQLIIDALPEAVIAVDRQRRIRFVNIMVAPLFGYSPAELIGQPVEMLVPIAQRDQHARQHMDFFGHPAPRRMGSGIDVQGLSKDGRLIPLDIALSPVPTAEGFLVVAAIHDITLHRQSEAALREAKAAADRASLAKSRFLAATSHDLRQPLQTIGLMLAVLAKRISDPDSRSILAKLHGPIASMGALLDTLLDINQIESGAVRPEISEFSLSSLLQRKADEFGPQAAAKGLEFRVVRSTAVIRSDLRLLERMLDNLVSNAIKYTERGKILLGCRRRGATVRIEVWDTGIGIPSADLPHVFDEFYRVDRPTGGRFGLGLGLYIVQRFAQLLGHAVEVHSSRHAGSVFSLTISVGQGLPQPQASARAGGNGAPSAASSRPSILVLEDDPAQLDSLRLLLELDGYRVVPVRTAHEALVTCRHPDGFRPDVVVADFNLPGDMNGLQLIQRMRSEWAAEIPALIVSGDKTLATLRSLREGGLVPITKPVKPDALLSAVGALFETLRPGWQARRQSGPIAATPAAVQRDADICVIEDEPDVRDAIRMTLEAEGYRVSTYASSEAFLAAGARKPCRCLVVDVGLPGMSGLALQQQLKSEHVETPIIFVTGDRDLPVAVAAMREGAADFLQKPVRSAELCASVARAMELGTLNGSQHAEQDEVDARLATLTERERQVMDRFILGHANKVIASELGISQRTVEHHRQSVMRKMAAKSLAMLVRMMGPRLR